MCSSYGDILNMAWHWVRDLNWNQNSKKRLCIPVLKIPASHFRDLCVRKKIMLYKLKMCSSGCILCKAINMERDVGMGHCLCSRLRNSPMKSSVPRALWVGILPSVQLVLCSPAVFLLYPSIWRIDFTSSLPGALLSCGTLREGKKLPNSTDSL